METQGKKEVVEAVLVALLCQIAVEGVVICADLFRRRKHIWRCPECNKSEKPDA